MRCYSVLLCLLEKRVDFKQAKVRVADYDPLVGAMEVQHQHRQLFMPPQA